VWKGGLELKVKEKVRPGYQGPHGSLTHAVSDWNHWKALSAAVM
jgi:hypothetical protein